MARLTTTAPPIRTQRPDVPAELDDLVHKCLARDPARRFTSAADVRAALAAIRPQTAGVPSRPVPRAPAPAPAPRPTPRPAKARPARRRTSSGATWFFVVVVFLLAIAGAVLAFVIASS
jgi:serine/threonine-protein kinase